MPPHGKVDATSTPNGWNQWGNHVLTELKTLNVRTSEMEKSLVHVLVRVEGLSVRSSIFGAIGGAIIVVLLRFFGDFIVGKG